MHHLLLLSAGVTDQVVAAGADHHDTIESSGKGMAVLFWIFAAASVAGALFVVSRRNLIVAVMGMVGSFLGIAAVYMLLYAHFLAVVQMLVYAGAIMVLFVFVIMILNRPEDEPVAPTGHVGQVIGGISILYLIFRLVVLLWHVNPVGDPAKVEAATSARDLAEEHVAQAEMAVAQAAGQPVTAPRPTIEPQIALANARHELDEATRAYQLATSETAPPPVQLPDGQVAPWGTVKAVGSDLFGGGLFPFEAISILLLIAVVGAIAIAKPLRNNADDADDDEPEHPLSAGEDLVTAARTSGGHAS